MEYDSITIYLVPFVEV